MIKKLAATVVLVTVASLCVAGCTTSQNTQQNQTTPLTNAINIVVKQVQSPQQFNGSPETLRPGDKYVMYNVSFTNVNASYRQVSALYFGLHDSDNNVYNIDQLVQSKYLSKAFSYAYTTTQPGDKVTGRIVFEVPQNTTLKSLTYFDGTTKIVTTV